MAAQLGLRPEKFAVLDQKCFCKEAETSLATGLSKMIKSGMAEQAFDQCYVM